MSGAEAGLAFARFVHFAASLCLFGALVYAVALAPAGHARRFAPALSVAAPALALLALASAVAWAAFVARDLVGDGASFDALRDLLDETAFGAVWRARLAGLALLAALTFGRRWRASAGLAGAAVASLGLVGHAAMQTGGLGVAHRLNAAAHLLCVAFWLGGLPLFLVSLRIYGLERQSEALAAMRRFSCLGHFAVAGVFLTGLGNIALTTQALPWPLTSPYRLGLIVKAAVFTAMTGLAVLNRYAFAPRAGRSRSAATALAAGAALEIALALLALALVADFATHDPA